MARPDKTPPATAMGAIFSSLRSENRLTSATDGCASRVQVMGTRLMHTSMAASAKRVKFIGLSSCNSCWVSASEPRLTAMYTANT